MGMMLFFTLSLLAAGIFLSRSIFGVDAVANRDVLNHFDTNPAALNAMRLIQILSSIGAFLIPALVFPKALRQWPSQFNRSSMIPSWQVLLTGILLMILATPFTSWIIQWNQDVHLPASMTEIEQKLRASENLAEQLTNAFVKADSTGIFLLNLFIVGILPAICEEFFFRGALMRFLMMCIRNKHIAIALTAFVFSAIHGQFFGFIARFVLGLLLGYIAYYCNSIWPAVLAHFFNNALALAAKHYQWDQSSLSILREDYVFPLYIVILSLGLTLFLLYRMKLKSQTLSN